MYEKKIQIGNTKYIGKAFESYILPSSKNNGYKLRYVTQNWTFCS